MSLTDNPVTRAIDSALERLEQKARETLSPADLRKRYRAMLVRVLSKMHSVALQNSEQRHGTILHGVVVASLDPLTIKNGNHPELGVSVVVVRSERSPDMVGKKGYVLTEPDDEGDVFIASDDGAVGYFTWHTDSDKTEITIDQVPENRLLLSVAGRLIDVPVPEKMELIPGDAVRVAAKTHTILEKIEKTNQGDVVVVKRILNNGRCFVKHGDGLRLVSSGKFHDTLTIGRQVLVDSGYNAVIEDLGDPETDFHLTEATGVSWEDIGGLESAKEQLQDTIDLPNKDPEVFQYYQGEVPKGMILIGPPGGGKGMLANAYATALGAFHGEAVPRGFIVVKGPEILKGIVGAAEELIRDIFAEGNRLYDELGYCVIFIDEIDAVGKKRGTGISSDVYDSIVPALLTELNGFRGMFIAATNRVDILDPALIRSGRIDLKIVVPRPDIEAAIKIFRVHLRGIPLHEVGIDGIATHAVNLMFDDDHAFYRLDLAKKTDEEEQRSILFTLGHITSGAMIEAIVNAAKRIAMKRDLASEQKTGISKEDIALAVTREFEQNVPLDHTDAIKEFVADLTDKVTHVHKLRQGRNE